MEEFLKTAGSDDQVFLLSDLNCGSVNQAMYNYVDRPNTTIITGINLPLVLDLLSRDSVAPKDVKEIVMSNREMMYVVGTEDSLKADKKFF